MPCSPRPRPDADCINGVLVPKTHVVIDPTPMIAGTTVEVPSPTVTVQTSDPVGIVTLALVAVIAGGFLATNLRKVRS